jgi:hypothetical protein
MYLSIMEPKKDWIKFSFIIESETIYFQIHTFTITVSIYLKLDMNFQG